MTAFSRWITYQRERFPVAGHGLLILAFSSGAVCYSAQLRAMSDSTPATVSAASLLVAFISSFLFFFQLRVSDEHKDLADDTKWRPYRPVPRGLVTLAELRNLGFLAMAIQLALALWLAPRLLGLLLIVWLYMGLMTREFWLHDYLKTHPFTTLWTHMLIIPFIDLYATACDWMVAQGAGFVLRTGILWFLLASFGNGMVVELGRKLRAPVDEEEGVETYSKLWGRPHAVGFWLCVMVMTAWCAIIAASHVGGARIVAVTLCVLLAVALVLGIKLAIAPSKGAGKKLELISGLWTVGLYVSVGVIPFFANR